MDIVDNPYENFGNYFSGWSKTSYYDQREQPKALFWSYATAFDYSIMQEWIDEA